MDSIAKGTTEVKGRPRIAVVEDDPELRDQILLPLLGKAGFDVTGMGSALDLYRAMVGEHFDLVLLDVGLPDEDGFSIARHLRSQSPLLGIVMLTAYTSGPDRVRGLEAGVDVYVPKPADMNELIATLRNLYRRIELQPAAAVSKHGWRLDQRGWSILSPNGARVELNLAQRQVMAMLVAAAGTPVGREALIGRLIENVHDFDPHRLEMLVHRLRKKCLELTGSELPLRAVRGVGYTLDW